MKTLTPTAPAKNPKKLSTSQQDDIQIAATSTPEVKESPKTDLTAPFALQKRVMLFAVGVRSFIEKLPKQLALSDDSRQLARASGSLGMHAIEADEAVSKKAFTMHMSMCKKDVKEVLYWLQLLDRSLMGFTERRRQELYKEAHELRRIFTAIVKTAIKNG